MHISIFVIYRCQNDIFLYVSILYLCVIDTYRNRISIRIFHEKAFRGLKATLCIPSIPRKVTDASKVIGYCSKVLTKPKRNYCVTRKELLAVVKSIDRRPGCYSPIQKGKWLGGWKYCSDTIFKSIIVKEGITTTQLHCPEGRVENASNAEKWMNAKALSI